jgi:hypothetical protein
MTTPRFRADRVLIYEVEPLLVETCQDPSRLSLLSLWGRSIFIAMQNKCKAGIRASQEHENLLAMICMCDSNTYRGPKGTATGSTKSHNTERSKGS